MLGSLRLASFITTNTTSPRLVTSLLSCLRQAALNAHCLHQTRAVTAAEMGVKIHVTYCLFVSVCPSLWQCNNDGNFRSVTARVLLDASRASKEEALRVDELQF
ncbi:hypothetical protein NFI96_032106 [Prochilodus magdalenae]|nr:hypothetical protein NFI96_032106 [Prochilodus magdalenae]